MRLIKLSTDGVSGSYSNYFREPIIIPENAKIGLKTASISLSSKVIEVNGNNNHINFKLVDSSPYDFDVYIPSGKYSYSDFLQQLYESFNSALPHREGASPATGLYDMFQFSFDSSRKLEVSYHKGNIAFPTLLTSSANITIDESAKSVSNPSASVPYSKIVYTNDLFAKSNGFIKFQNPRIDTAYAIGLTTFNVSNNATLAPGDFAFGYRFVYNDVFIVMNGVEYQITAYKHAVDDTYYIAFHDGYVDFFVLTDTGLVENYLTLVVNEYNIPDENYNIDFKTDYTFATSFATEGDITNLFYSRDPFVVDTATGSSRVIRALPNDVINSDADLNKYKSSTQASKISVTFVNNSNKLLGWGTHQTLSKTSTHFRITSPAPIDILDNSRLLLVNLPNISKMNSYDGSTNKRENVIEVIPLNLNESFYVNYDPHTIHYVDVNNPQPISLQNFQVRLTNEKYETLELDDGADIVLLVE